MNEQNLPEPKLLGLPRRSLGAAIGVLVFLLFTAPIYIFQAQIKPLLFLYAGLISPGMAVWFIIAWFSIVGSFEIPLSLDLILFFLLAFGFSSIPVAIIGSHLASTKKSVRTTGIVFLIVYLAMALCASGSFFYGFFE